MFSVFSFNKNKLYLNGPLERKREREREKESMEPDLSHWSWNPSKQTKFQYTQLKSPQIPAFFCCVYEKQVQLKMSTLCSSSSLGEISVVPKIAEGHLFPFIEICKLLPRNYNITLLVGSDITSSIPSSHLHSLLFHFQPTKDIDGISNVTRVQPDPFVPSLTTS